MFQPFGIMQYIPVRFLQSKLGYNKKLVGLVIGKFQAFLPVQEKSVPLID